MPVTNAALGDFLRSRRERISADALGLATIRRRRTPGLRREEVADAAGISVEWLVKLEQGRAVSPPASTVAALAAALRLDAIECAHLRRLAGAGDTPRFVRERVPAALRRLVESLPHPAYVTGQRWDLLAWNARVVDLFGDFCAAARDDRNILLFVLTDPRAKTLFGSGWAMEAKRMVALFRTTFDLFAEDPAFRDLVDRVRTGCAAFDAWWREHDVRAPSSGVKTLHIAGSKQRFRYTTFQANDDPALKLAIYLDETVVSAGNSGVDLIGGR